MLNVGIIGAGRMGNAHAANFAKLKSAALTAVYDIDPAKANAFKEKYPAVAIKNSAAELVGAPEVDLVVITSPTYCHKEGLLAAMATGKPIFCEKPLCRTPEDFKELAPLITSYKNLFAIGFVRRYSPGVVLMEKLISEGKIGKIICASVCCLFGGYRREWGDWFADYDKSGGVMLGAFFMATDYATSPVTLNGQLLYGAGCGALTVLIRYFGGFPEGVSYAILIMNLCSWAIDKGFHRHQFGVSKEDIAAEKAAKKAAKKEAV